MSSLTDVIAQEAVERIDGVEYRVAPLAINKIAVLQRAIDLLPCPDRVGKERLRAARYLEMGAIDEAESRRMVAEAIAEESSWPPRMLFDPRSADLLMTHPDIQAAFLAAALGVDADAAARMATTMLFPQYARIYSATFNAGDDDPKANPADDASVAP